MSRRLHFQTGFFLLTLFMLSVGASFAVEAPPLFLWMSVLLAVPGVGGLARNTPGLCAPLPNIESITNALPVFALVEKAVAREDYFPEYRNYTDSASVTCVSAPSSALCQNQLKLAQEQAPAFQRATKKHRQARTDFFQRKEVAERGRNQAKKQQALESFLEKNPSLGNALQAQYRVDYAAVIASIADALNFFAQHETANQDQNPDVREMVCTSIARAQLLAELESNTPEYLHLVTLSDGPFGHEFMMKREKPFLFSAHLQPADDDLNVQAWRRIEAANSVVCDPWNAVIEPVTSQLYQNASRLYHQLKIIGVRCVDPRCLVYMLDAIKAAAPEKWPAFSARLKAVLEAGILSSRDRLKFRYQDVFSSRLGCSATFFQMLKSEIEASDTPAPRPEL